MLDFPADEAFLRSTLNELPVGLLLAAPDGQLLATNRALVDVLGYDSTALRAMTYRDLGHPDEVDQNARQFEQLISGELPLFRGVVRLVCADGSVVRGDMSAVLVRRADGTPQHFVAQVLDVTEQHDLLDQLAAANTGLDLAQRSMAAIFDTVDVGLLLIDRNSQDRKSVV